MQIVRNPFVFIGIIATVAALLLSIVSESTREKVKQNKDLDRMKNILLARYLEAYNQSDNPYKDKLSSEEGIKDEYRRQINEKLYSEDGKLVEGLNFSDLEWKENKKDGSMYYFFKTNKNKKYLPFFEVKDGGYIVPISGKGLWSTIKGFIYIVPKTGDLEFKIKGISFYQHGETPGLGGEIDKLDVKYRYFDEEIDLNSNNVAEMVKAYNSNDKDDYKLQYISGATITSDGLNDFIKRDLNRYKEILRKVK